MQNGLLEEDGGFPARPFGIDSEPTLVMSAWKFCRRFHGYALALGTTFALHMADRMTDCARADCARADVLATVNAAPAYHDLFRHRSTAVTNSVESRAEYMQHVCKCYELVRGVEPSLPLPDVPNLTYAEITGTHHRDQLDAMFSVVKRVFPEWQDLVVRSVSMIERWTTCIKQCKDIRESLQSRVKAIDAQLIHAVTVVAADHLPKKDLDSQLLMFSDAGTCYVVDARAVLATPDLQARRGLPWRVELDEEVRAELHRQVRREHARQQVLEELMREDGPPKPRGRKARRALAKPPAQPAVQPSTQPAEEDDEEPEECVVCLEQQREVMNMPCGHTVMCVQCADGWMQRAAECPICRCPMILFLPVM